MSNTLRDLVENEHVDNHDARATEASRKVIVAMVNSLNDHVIDGQNAHWHSDAIWHGPHGAGVKPSLKAFQDGWQRSFLNAFPDKYCKELIRIAEGNFVASYGYQECTHGGEFMGIPATGKQCRVYYMDFWEVEDGKIKNNWVLLDIIRTMRELGVDPLQGKGWDDRGEGFSLGY